MAAKKSNKRPSKRPKNALTPMTSNVKETKADASRGKILGIAQKLFARRGFEGVSIREIAQAVGMTTASLYYHFPSKEEIFVAVHGRSLEAVQREVMDAIAGLKDPWDRLEAAAAAHSRNFASSERTGASIAAEYYEGSLAPFRKIMVPQRDAYERLIAMLVADLQLPKSVDARLFRLQLLGALNWLPVWYRPGRGLSVEEVAREFVRNFRRGLDPAFEAAIRQSRKRKPRRAK
jgi:AcrR family transcriptional regulator